MSRRCEVKVISPCPWFLPIKFFKRWYQYTLRPRHEMRKGIEVFRPRYLIFPRDFLTFAGVGYFFAALVIATKLMKVFDYDIIHAHSVYPDGFAAVLLGKILRKPVIVTVHASNLDKLARASLGRVFFVKFALRNATLVISVGKRLRDSSVRYGAPHDRVRIVPNGVDLQKFRPPLGSLKHCSKRILFVGHLIRRKGVGYLLGALRILSDQGYDDWELNIVGDGRERSALVRKARELKLDSRVHFLGALPSEEVADEMHKCDFLVLPSLHESFGVVLIEAMACGKPVVACRSGGAEEIVTEETGVLVPVKDEIALAQGVKEVLTNLVRYDNKSILSYVRSNFSFDKVVTQIVKAYDEALQLSFRRC